MPPPAGQVWGYDNIANAAPGFPAVTALLNMTATGAGFGGGGRKLLAAGDFLSVGSSATGWADVAAMSLDGAEFLFDADDGSGVDKGYVFPSGSAGLAAAGEGLHIAGNSEAAAEASVPTGDSQSPGGGSPSAAHQDRAARATAGRRLLQGGPFSYALTAYCGGSPMHDRIEMTLTDGSGNVVWQLEGASMDQPKVKEV